MQGQDDETAGGRDRAGCGVCGARSGAVLWAGRVGGRFCGPYRGPIDRPKRYRVLPGYQEGSRGDGHPRGRGNDPTSEFVCRMCK